MPRVEIDHAEMACRIYEAMTRSRRPEGASAKEALESLQREIPGMGILLLDAASAVADYVIERVKGAGGFVLEEGETLQ